MGVTGDEWLEGFVASLPMCEHMLFGQVALDGRTGRIVACNPRGRQLLGGTVPERVQDLVAAGVLARPSLDELVAHATGPHPASWRSKVSLHLPSGRADLVVLGGTVEHPGIDARAVVVMIAEQAHERIWVDHDPLTGAPTELLFAYDGLLRVRAIDPRLGVYWENPTKGLGGYLWMSIHPADLALAAPGLARVLAGEVDGCEFTVRTHTHLGNWTPAHYEVRRLLGLVDAPIAVTLTLVGGFRESIAPGQLTPREVAVVGALFDGHRVAQIAARDGVSVKTLRNQLTAVYRKLGVADQLELLSTFHRPAEAPKVRLDTTGWSWPGTPGRDQLADDV